MKRLSFFILSILPFSLSAQTNVVAVNANIKGLKAGGQVYCKAVDESFLDSVKATASGFHFKLNIPEGEGNVFLFVVNDGKSAFSDMPVFLDKGTVTITGNETEFKNARISGPASAKDFVAYNDFLKNNAQLKTRDALYEKVNDMYAKNDTVDIAAFDPQLIAADSIRKMVITQWVSEHAEV